MTTNTPRQYWVIIPAAGVGSRMASDTPKQYINIQQKTVLEHTLNTLLAHPKVSGAVIAISKNDEYWRALEYQSKKTIIEADGGLERCHSVYNALCRLSDRIDPEDWVLVHDAARPCIRLSDIDKLINELGNNPIGGLLAVPVKDTIKLAKNGHWVKQTIDRSQLWQAQTPQMFRYQILTSALAGALENNFLVTDEASAVEFTGKSPQLVEGHSDNIKITHPEDVELARYYLTQVKN